MVHDELGARRVVRARLITAIYRNTKQSLHADFSLYGAILEGASSAASFLHAWQA